MITRQRRLLHLIGLVLLCFTLSAAAQAADGVRDNANDFRDSATGLRDIFKDNVQGDASDLRSNTVGAHEVRARARALADPLPAELDQEDIQRFFQHIVPSHQRRHHTPLEQVPDVEDFTGYLDHAVPGVHARGEPAFAGVDDVDHSLEHEMGNYEQHDTAQGALEGVRGQLQNAERSFEHFYGRDGGLGGIEKEVPGAGQLLGQDGLPLGDGRLPIGQDGLPISQSELGKGGLPIGQDGLPIGQGGLGSGGLPIGQGGSPLDSLPLGKGGLGQAGLPLGQGVGPDGFPIGKDGLSGLQTDLPVGKGGLPVRRDGLPILGGGQGGLPLGQNALPNLRQSGLPLSQNGWPIGQGGLPVGRDGLPLLGKDGLPLGQGGLPVGQGGLPTGKGGLPLLGRDGLPLVGQNGLPLNDIPLGQDGLPIGQGKSPLGSNGLPIGQNGLPIGQDGLPIGQDGLPTGQDGLPFGKGMGGSPFSKGGLPLVGRDGLPLVGQNRLPVLGQDGLPLGQNGLPIGKGGLPLLDRDGLALLGDDGLPTLGKDGLPLNDLPMTHEGSPLGSLPTGQGGSPLGKLPLGQGGLPIGHGGQPLVGRDGLSVTAAKGLVGKDGLPLVGEGGLPVDQDGKLLGRDGLPLLGQNGLPLGNLPVGHGGLPLVGRDGLSVTAAKGLLGKDGLPVIGQDGLPLGQDGLPIGKGGSQLLGRDGLSVTAAKGLLGKDGLPLVGKGGLPLDQDGRLVGRDGLPLSEQEILSLLGAAKLPEGDFPLVGRDGVPFLGQDGLPLLGGGKLPLGQGGQGGIPLVGRDGLPLMGEDGLPLLGKLPLGQGGQGGLPLGQGGQLLGRDGLPILGNDGLPLGQNGLPISQNDLPLGKGGLPIGHGGLPLLGRDGLPVVGENGLPLGKDGLPLLGKDGLPISTNSLPLLGRDGLPIIGQNGLPLGQDGMPLLGKGGLGKNGPALLGRDGLPLVGQHGLPLGQDGLPLLGKDGLPIGKNGLPLVGRDGLPLFGQDELPLGKDGLPLLGSDGLPIGKDGLPLVGQNDLPVGQGGVPKLGQDGLPLGKGGLPLLGRDGLPLVGENGLPLVGQNGLPLNGQNGLSGLGQGGLPLLGRDGLPLLGQDGLPVLGQNGLPLGKGGLPLVGRDGLPLVGEDGLPLLGQNGLPLGKDGLPVGQGGLPLLGRDGLPLVGQDGLPLLGKGGLPVSENGLPLTNRLSGLGQNGLPLGRRDGLPLVGEDGLPLIGNDGLPLGQGLPLGKGGLGGIGQRGLPLIGQDGVPFLGKDGLPLHEGDELPAYLRNALSSSSSHPLSRRGEPVDGLDARDIGQMVNAPESVSSPLDAGGQEKGGIFNTLKNAMPSFFSSSSKDPIRPNDGPSLEDIEEPLGGVGGLAGKAGLPSSFKNGVPDFIPGSQRRNEDGGLQDIEESLRGKMPGLEQSTSMDGLSGTLKQALPKELQDQLQELLRRAAASDDRPMFDNLRKAMSMADGDDGLFEKLRDGLSHDVPGLSETNVRRDQSGGLQDVEGAFKHAMPFGEDMGGLYESLRGQLFPNPFKESKKNPPANPYPHREPLNYPLGSLAPGEAFRRNDPADLEDAEEDVRHDMPGIEDALDLNHVQDRLQNVNPLSAVRRSHHSGSQHHPLHARRGQHPANDPLSDIDEQAGGEHFLESFNPSEARPSGVDEGRVICASKPTVAAAIVAGDLWPENHAVSKPPVRRAEPVPTGADGAAAWAESTRQGVDAHRDPMGPVGDALREDESEAESEGSLDNLHDAGLSERDEIPDAVPLRPAKGGAAGYLDRLRSSWLGGGSGSAEEQVTQLSEPLATGLPDEDLGDKLSARAGPPSGNDRPGKLAKLPKHVPNPLHHQAGFDSADPLKHGPLVDLHRRNAHEARANGHRHKQTEDDAYKWPQGGMGGQGYGWGDMEGSGSGSGSGSWSGSGSGSGGWSGRFSLAAGAGGKFGSSYRPRSDAETDEDGGEVDHLVHSVWNQPEKGSDGVRADRTRVNARGASPSQNVEALLATTLPERLQSQTDFGDKFAGLSSAFTPFLKSRDDAVLPALAVGGNGDGEDPALNNAKLRANIARGIKNLQTISGSPYQFIDLADLVNPFIGTEANNNPGNIMPGASVPFGMAKVTVDVDQYAPAGYVTNVTGLIRGMSYLHDSGTGSSSGSYGNFESMPTTCPGDDFFKCKVLLDDRKRKRKAGQDEASPGYFSLTLDNGIKMEATATAKSALLRYTYPKGSGAPFVVQDWTNDLPGTFRGGRIDFDTQKGLLKLNGSWGSSFGSGIYTYDAFACIDTSRGGKQKLGKAGLFQGDRFGQDTKLLHVEHANLSRNFIGGQPTQAGALFSFDKFGRNKQGDAEILMRVGLSFNSVEQACQNAEQETGGDWNFEGIVKKARDAWNVKLNRIPLDPKTQPHIAELFYSSLYYSFLTPNNATGEAGRYFPKGHKKPYYASLYCTWDTYRTFFPFLSLTSAQDYADVVENYVDAWRVNGWVPECRANNVPGLTQVGSNGVMVIADYLAKYGDAVKKGLLPGNVKDAYEAVYKDAYVTPEDWNSYGRQVGVYAQYGYVPFAVFDTYSTGRQTRETSRTMEYAHNDFGARTVALVAGHQDVADALGKRSLNYRNTFDKSVKSMGFTNFVQQRRTDGSFKHTDPTTCSPIDPKDHACSLQQENTYGVYETSSWEWSLYAPHDSAGLIELLTNQKHTSQGARDLFSKRLDKFFDAKLFYPGNEPSFQTPLLYHYINAPVKSVKRIRNVVYDNFNTTTGGLPGNSDSGATNTLLLFHLLGLYPVPVTKEFLLASPFMPSYDLRNDFHGNTHIQVQDFDDRTLQRDIPSGARAYIDKVLINGKEHTSRCKIQFDELFGEAPPGEKTRIITLIMTDDESRANSCGNGDEALPGSLSTGGFRTF